MKSIRILKHNKAKHTVRKGSKFAGAGKNTGSHVTGNPKGTKGVK